jgi:hypothetical protein
MSHDFNNGYVSSSIAGVVGTKIAHSGEIVRPGDTIAEIYDMSELYIIWHIPAFYLKMPHIGDGVYVQYGQNIFPAYVYEIKNIAEPANETNQSILRDKQQQQIIYVKLKDRSSLLPINAPVTIRMNYNHILDRLMDSFTGKPQ